MSSSNEGAELGGVRIVRPRWNGAVLVCGKCLKRHPDGKAMRRAIKDEAKVCAAAGRKARIVKTACLGLCPKRAVVIASGATLAAGEVVIVRNTSDVVDALPSLPSKAFSTKVADFCD